MGKQETEASCSVLNRSSVYRPNRGCKTTMYLNELNTTIFNDNLNAIRLAYSQKFSARTKHVGVLIQLVKDCIDDGLLTLEHMSSFIKPADMLTKALAEKKDHTKCCQTLKLTPSD
ncbi:LOW QUALITY PROTEIN: hypothetical protein KUF71_019928 [Frankliniella fusca]|uniref:Uncharacterized protein n=1 Tax=Frankliniella fusca TaxID=407009 RepID=A0AAE1L8Q1_9NEOP|nr:LOW QUALITY PROTEIN: hypothetical protein KUF71_019928 [Frankliniella fusca]